MSEVSVLDRPVYTYAQVDRLLDLTTGTARRWINGYKSGSNFYAPVIRPDALDTTWVKWGEYVEARLLRGWRDFDDVPIGKLRKVADALRQSSKLKYPLAHYSTLMKPVGRRMVWEAQQIADLPEGFLVEVASNQVFDWAPFVNAFLHEARFGPEGEDDSVDRVVEELQADPDFPLIRLNPRLRGGEPTIAGRSIRAVTVGNLVVEAGEDVDDVADWYQLSEDEVRQAVGYTRTHLQIA